MCVVLLEGRVVEVPGELGRGHAEREAVESHRRALAHLEILGHLDKVGRDVLGLVVVRRFSTCGCWTRWQRDGDEQVTGGLVAARRVVRHALVLGHVAGTHRFDEESGRAGALVVLLGVHVRRVEQRLAVAQPDDLGPWLGVYFAREKSRLVLARVHVLERHDDADVGRVVRWHRAHLGLTARCGERLGLWLLMLELELAKDVRIDVGRVVHGGQLFDDQACAGRALAVRIGGDERVGAAVVELREADDEHALAVAERVVEEEALSGRQRLLVVAPLDSGPRRAAHLAHERHVLALEALAVAQRLHDQRRLLGRVRVFVLVVVVVVVVGGGLLSRRVWLELRGKRLWCRSCTLLLLLRRRRMRSVEVAEEVRVDIGRLVDVGHGLDEELTGGLRSAVLVLGQHVIGAHVRRLLGLLDAQRGDACGQVVVDVEALRGHQLLAVLEPRKLYVKLSGRLHKRGSN